mmetsp:Transcript_103505/g.221327  ORF Transcript_103505/g.221327 Transcript_103505/m.221327 type:complete len:218 (+) Transcript_103505:1753-2406(+)
MTRRHELQLRSLRTGGAHFLEDVPRQRGLLLCILPAFREAMAHRNAVQGMRLALLILDLAVDPQGFLGGPHHQIGLGMHTVELADGKERCGLHLLVSHLPEDGQGFHPCTQNALIGVAPARVAVQLHQGQHHGRLPIPIVRLHESLQILHGEGLCGSQCFPHPHSAHQQAERVGHAGLVAKFAEESECLLARLLRILMGTLAEVILRDREEHGRLAG